MGRQEALGDLALKRRARGVALTCLLALVTSGCGVEPESGRPVAVATAVEPAALAQRIASGDAPLVLDVRSEGEFAAGHIPGATNIPYDQLASRLAELPGDREREIVVHCQSGRRAEIAEGVLAEAGYANVHALSGHWAAWSAAELPRE